MALLAGAGWVPFQTVMVRRPLQIVAKRPQIEDRHVLSPVERWLRVSISTTARELSTFRVTKSQLLPISFAILGHYPPSCRQSVVPSQIPRAVSRTVSSATDKERGGIPMRSITSDRIYLWSKRFGAGLLIAMAIVAAGNAQQFSGGGKGKGKGQMVSINFDQDLGSRRPLARCIGNHTTVQRTFSEDYSQGAYSLPSCDRGFWLRLKCHLLRIYLQAPAFLVAALILGGGARAHKEGRLLSGKATGTFVLAFPFPSGSHHLASSTSS
jgi:hypothetical protein